MESQLPELMTPLPLLNSADISGGENSAKVVTCDSDEIVLLIHIGAGLAANADNQVIITINQFNSAGNNIGLVDIDHYWKLDGATIAGTNGQLGNNLTRLSPAVQSLTSLVAEGTKELYYAIVIRTRSLKVKTKSIDVGLQCEAARKVHVTAIRNEQYGAPRSPALFV